MMKFKVSPSVRAAAVPTGAGFAGFEGLKRHCMEYKVTGSKHSKGGQALRCVRFKKGRGKPRCDWRLTDGGRSPHLVRNGKCPTSPPAQRRRPSRRRAR
jgi:hypothetical protein